MNIGIVSDTHGNLDYVEKATDWLIRTKKIASLYHLGDEYDDVAGLAEKFIDIVQVPGIYDNRYKNGTIPGKLFESVLGIAIMLVHSYDKDVNRNDLVRSDIVLFGHTHHHELRLEDGKFFMNPGHLKGSLDKNMPPSFGLLSIDERTISASIWGLDFKLKQSMEILRSESGLYKTS